VEKAAKKINKRKDPELLTEEKSSVRSKIIPNNSKSLWDAVKLAKNSNI
jgi:hypothetical protein